MSNKYIGFRVGSGVMIGIISLLLLFIPPYIIGLYIDVMNGNSTQYLPILPDFILELFKIFDLDLLRFNAKLFAPFLVAFAIIKKKTATRIIVNILMLILLIYGYTIGSNLFTLGLPTVGFAQIGIDLNLNVLLGDSGGLSNLMFMVIFNFRILAIMILITATLGTVKSVFQFLDVVKQES